MKIDAGRRSLAGGIAYRLVPATPMEVLSALRQPGGLRESLPYTKSARILSEKNGVTRVALEQGHGPFVGRYTVAIHWRPGEQVARFWLDPRRPHDLEDIWGFFRVREIAPGRTLVTFGVAFDLGSGLVGALFEDTVQRMALRTPRDIDRYVRRFLRDRGTATSSPAAVERQATPPRVQ